MCDQVRRWKIRFNLRQPHLRSLLSQRLFWRTRFQYLRKHSSTYKISYLECKTATNDRYADTYTRTCVFPISCSLGYFADSSTQSCVITCPKAASPSNIVGATVGHPVSRVCQTSCASPYFADFVAGLCVTNCITNGTFSDVSSNRVCVTACSNTTGLTPWADSSTYTCVSGTFGSI
jgi:hypothetical protein